MKIKAILPATLASDIISGKIQNLGLIRLLDYTVNDIPGKSEDKYLLVTKCEAVASTLESEIKSESKASTCITLKPKHEFVAKSASQIINEQRGNAAPAARMAMTRSISLCMLVYFVLFLNLYFSNDDLNVIWIHR